MLPLIPSGLSPTLHSKSTLGSLLLLLTLQYFVDLSSTSLICFGQQPRTHFYYLFVGGAEDKGECGETRGHHGNVYRTSLPVPQIPILLQAYSSAFSHLSSTHFAPQVVFVGVGSEVRDPEGKGKIQTVSL